MSEDVKTVVVLGATDQPDRFSNMAVKLFKEAGYRVIPVNPMLEVIEGLTVARSLDDIGVRVDILTVYVKFVSLYTDSILRLNPDLVIFNPGVDAQEIEKDLIVNNVAFSHADTVDLLRSGKFDTLGV